MMARTIHVMSDALASKIAAGEVVGRPASVVKELLENSIDAGAKSVHVVVKESGKSLIQVTDDGSGMGREDAALAFGRHATSKITAFEDLERIRTFGFRGEALASIAAVSRVELRTRLATEDVGTLVRVEGGETLEIADTGTPPGTLVRVKNLFYNTPARRHFLKSDPTEFRHIIDAIQKCAIAYPSLAFRFSSDDEEVFHLPPAPHMERIRALFGDRLASTLFPFDETLGPMRVSGFLGKPDFARKGKMDQYLYLNKRPITSRSLNHAVFHAYENLLEKGSFPFFILFLETEPDQVDVNVHPSKQEVKFGDEQLAYRAVMGAVRKALSDHDLVPTMSAREGGTDEARLRLAHTQGSASGDLRQRGWEELLRPPAEGGWISSVTGTPGLTPPSGGEQPVGNIGQEVGSPSTPADRIWQVHNKYLIVPTAEGILLVDQHAAHERVLYERIIARMAAKEPECQQLLFPLTVDLTPSDAALVKQLLPLLESIGFNLKMFGATTVVIDGVPTDVRAGGEASILQGVLDLYKEDEQRVRLEPRERLAKTYACKAAVKSGDPLRPAEISSLMNQLFATEIPFVCPHGRPVIIKLSFEELDRRFSRTS